MKIRNGFVSNSSSSSFILKIVDESDNVINELLNTYFSYFEYNILFEKLTKYIAYLKDSCFKKHNGVSEKIKDLYTKRLKEKLVEYEKYMEYLVKNKDNKEEQGSKEWFFLALKIFDISFSEEKNIVILSSWTSMYNSTEDIPKILLDIKEHYLQNHKEKPVFLNIEKDY